MNETVFEKNHNSTSCLCKIILFFSSPERSGRYTPLRSTVAPSHSHGVGAGSCPLSPRTCRGSYSLSRPSRERLSFCLHPSRCPQTTDQDGRKTPSRSPGHAGETVLKWVTEMSIKVYCNFGSFSCVYEWETNENFLDVHTTAVKKAWLQIQKQTVFSELCCLMDKTQVT